MKPAPAEPPRFPKLVATSVIRGGVQGESHGGVYLIDMNTGRAALKFDWNCGDIDFDGRGGDRGLRGIAFYKDDIYIAASDEIFIFDQQFNIKSSIRSHFLKHCHEICIRGDKLYATSTGFDSILVYDLAKGRFTGSYFIDAARNAIHIRTYNPDSARGPAPSNRLHVNSVASDDAGLCFSGRKAPFLFRLEGARVSVFARIAKGSHNAGRHDGGVLYNDTESDRIRFDKGGRSRILPVPRHDRVNILNADRYETALARPGFARGLCAISPAIVAGGSSPGTVSLYDLEGNRLLKSVNLSMDVRNAIHGLEVWPFGNESAGDRTVRHD